VMWINPVTIKSETSSREYTVSELEINGYPTKTYGCSCPGWKAYGHCKHLDSMGLPSSRDRTMPALKGYGKSDNSTFQDSAYSHYDPYKEGTGTSSEWRKLAERVKGGNVRVAPSNTEWAEIFRLVDERNLSENDIEYLDGWLMDGDKFKNLPGVIIAWLHALPMREK
jgi:hypothetical protein